MNLNVLAKNGDTFKAAALIAAGVKVDNSSRTDTPLIHALRKGHYDFVVMLQGFGANLNARESSMGPTDDTVRTALMLCLLAAYDDPRFDDLAVSWLGQGLNPGQVDKEGHTLFYYARRGRARKTFDYLLKHLSAPPSGMIATGIGRQRVSAHSIWEDLIEAHEHDILLDDMNRALDAYPTCSDVNQRIDREGRTLGMLLLQETHPYNKGISTQEDAIAAFLDRCIALGMDPKKADYRGRNLLCYAKTPRMLQYVLGLGLDPSATLPDGSELRNQFFGANAKQMGLILDRFLARRAGAALPANHPVPADVEKSIHVAVRCSIDDRVVQYVVATPEGVVLTGGVEVLSEGELLHTVDPAVLMDFCVKQVMTATVVRDAAAVS